MKNQILTLKLTEVAAVSGGQTGQKPPVHLAPKDQTKGSAPGITNILDFCTGLAMFLATAVYIFTNGLPEGALDTLFDKPKKQPKNPQWPFSN